MVFYKHSKRLSTWIFPRYFNEEGTFWTIVGVNNDTKEALMNEDGMVEVDKKHFSIEPFLSVRMENLLPGTM